MKKKLKKFTIFIILSFFVVTTVYFTWGKYAYNSVWNYYLKSKGFYFESDLLETNTKKNSLLKWDGSDIYFLIKNSLNQKLVSEYDISYKVTCVVLGDESEYIDCALNGTNSSSFTGNLASNAFCVNNIDEEDVSNLTKAECELSGYAWKEEVATKNNYFNLVLKDQTKQIDEVSVKITAESITPYHKTLSGIFNINKIDAIDSEYDVNYQSLGEYDELTIINKTAANKCFSISFDSNDYSFDVDNKSILSYDVDSDKKVNQIGVQIEKQNSFTYAFYRINELKEYSIDTFVIEEKDC